MPERPEASTFRWRSLFLYLLPWTGIGLLGSLQIVLAYRYAGLEVSWPRALGLGLAQWYLWAALYPILAWTARKVPFARRSWLKPVLVHLPVTLVVSGIKVTTERALVAAIGFVPPQPPDSNRFNTALLIAWVLVGVAHATIYYRQSQTRRQRAIIFVTAYDAYAVRAFDAMALDYLLKPFDRDRFDQAIDRARQRLAEAADNPLSRQLEALLENRGKRYPDRLIVPDAGRIHFLTVDEIHWIEAQGNYVKIHTAGSSPMLRRPLKEMERRLDPARFACIHRSAIVSLAAIREMSPEAHGEYVVILGDGTRLMSGRACGQRVKAVLEDLL